MEKHSLFYFCPQFVHTLDWCFWVIFLRRPVHHVSLHCSPKSSHSWKNNAFQTKRLLLCNPEQWGWRTTTHGKQHAGSASDFWGIFTTGLPTWKRHVVMKRVLVRWKAGSVLPLFPPRIPFKVSSTLQPQAIINSLFWRASVYLVKSENHQESHAFCEGWHFSHKSSSLGQLLPCSCTKHTIGQFAGITTIGVNLDITGSLCSSDRSRGRVRMEPKTRRG